IKRVYDECNARYATILAEIETLTAERYAALTCGPEVVRRDAGRSVVFNSLSWSRAEWVRHGGAWRWVDVPALGCAELGGTELGGTELGGTGVPPVGSNHGRDA